MILNTIKEAFKYKDAFEETKVMSHEDMERLVNSRVAEKLSATKKDYEDYLSFKEMTSFQKVLSFVDTRAKIVETMLATTVYFKQEQEKLGFDTREKSFFKNRLEERFGKLVMNDNLSAGDFFASTIDLYGWYFASRNLSKEEIIYKMVQKVPISPIEEVISSIDEDIKKLEADMFPKEPRKPKHRHRHKK
jgi:hypothetical protein